MNQKNNRIYRALSAGIFLFLTLTLSASYRSEVYSAYVSNKMDNWKNVIDRMEAINNKDNELLLELVNYQYGYIGYCLGFDKKDEAKRYLEIAQDNLEILEKNKFSPSLVNSYKSAFYGYRISLNPITAPVNGIKSIDFAKTAVRLDSSNYFAYVQFGNIKFYMPAAFGGSKREALEEYLKAKDIYEKNQAPLNEDWNYLSLLIVIGQTYTYLKDYDSAKQVYNYILSIEPEFLYVKEDLYPRLLKIMAQ